MDNAKLDKLQTDLDYRFNNPELLRCALSHSSYANENRHSGAGSNERLEFLGDSVLGMAVAELIYKNEPGVTEGRMTRLRAELVCERNLTVFAKSLGLGGYLMLGRGEEKGGGRERSSILADAVEAILAAVYLDGGYESVIKLVADHIMPSSSLRCVANTDYKTALQEIVQETPGQTLRYDLTDESGPDHLKSFTVDVLCNGLVLGHGSGRTKKEAEQEAAKSALKSFPGYSPAVKKK